MMFRVVLDRGSREGRTGLCVFVRVCAVFFTRRWFWWDLPNPIIIISHVEILPCLLLVVDVRKKKGFKKKEKGGDFTWKLVHLLHT